MLFVCESVGTNLTAHKYVQEWGHREHSVNIHFDAAFKSTNRIHYKCTTEPYMYEKMLLLADRGAFPYNIYNTHKSPRPVYYLHARQRLTAVRVRRCTQWIL